MGIKHTFFSGKPDGPDATDVKPSDWNADHTIDGDIDLNGHAVLQPKLGGNLNPNGFGASNTWSPTASGTYDLGTSGLLWRDLYLQNFPTIRGRKLFPCVFPVSEYGAVCNGVTDDSTAINSAIQAAQSNNGGIVLFDIPCTPTAYYSIVHPLNITMPDVILMGYGAYTNDNHQNSIFPTTRIKWAGVPDFMVTIDHAADSTFPGLARNGLIGIALDGNNVASVGIYLRSVIHGRFEDLHIKQVTFRGMWMTCHLTADIGRGYGDNQHNLFRSISMDDITDATCFYLSGVQGNTSFNIFMDCHTETGGASGVGFWLDNADNNTFIDCGGFNGAGLTFFISSKSEEAVGGYSDNNYFLAWQSTGFRINGTEVGAGSHAPVANEFLNYDYANLPVIQTGTGVRYFLHATTVTPGWIPTITSTAGAIASVSAAGVYKKEYDVIYFTLRISLGNGGTASGYMRISLPFTPTNEGAFMGVNLNTNQALVGFVESGVSFASLGVSGTGAFPQDGAINVSGWFTF